MDLPRNASRRRLELHINRTIMEGKGIRVCLLFFCLLPHCLTPLYSRKLWMEMSRYVVRECIQRVVHTSRMASYVLHLRVTDVYVDLRQFEMLFFFYSSPLLSRWWVTMLWRRKKRTPLSKANCIRRQLEHACQRHRMQHPLVQQNEYALAATDVNPDGDVKPVATVMSVRLIAPLSDPR